MKINQVWPLSWLDQEHHYLCHPEKMEANHLISMIKERRIIIDNLEQMDISQLIEIYIELLLPYPQRLVKSHTRGIKRLFSENRENIKRLKMDFDINSTEIHS